MKGILQLDVLYEYKQIGGNIPRQRNWFLIIIGHCTSVSTVVGNGIKLQIFMPSIFLESILPIKDSNREKKTV